MEDFTFETEVLSPRDTFTGVIVELTGGENGATMTVVRSANFTPQQAQGLLQLASDNMILTGFMYTGEEEVNND